MNTASQILAKKGYDNAEQNDIICVNENCLDWQVRNEFGMNEPIHLYEAYYLGEADEDEMNEIAKKSGFDDYNELLFAMDRRLIEVAEDYPISMNAK